MGTGYIYIYIFPARGNFFVFLEGQRHFSFSVRGGISMFGGGLGGEFFVSFPGVLIQGGTLCFIAFGFYSYFSFLCTTDYIVPVLETSTHIYTVTRMDPQRILFPTIYRDIHVTVGEGIGLDHLSMVTS